MQRSRARPGVAVRRAKLPSTRDPARNPRTAPPRAILAIVAGATAYLCAICRCGARFAARHGRRIRGFGGEGASALSASSSSSSAPRRASFISTASSLVILRTHVDGPGFVIPWGAYISARLGMTPSKADILANHGFNVPPVWTILDRLSVEIDGATTACLRRLAERDLVNAAGLFAAPRVRL